MLAEAVNQTVGVGVGVLIGTGIGFGLRARRGNRDGLLQGSVWKTAVAAAMLAWVVAAGITLVL